MAKRMAKKKPARRTTPKARKPQRKAVKPIPAGYHTVTPYLTVSDGAGALELYKRAFGARETVRMPGEGGKVMHAELRVGDSLVMLSDAMPGPGNSKAPTSLGGTTGSIFLYVPNVDAAFQRAVEAGCRALMPPTDMFWGDRFGKLEDPFGHQWSMATHKEDVTPAEMKRRMQAMPGQPA
jgi:PhnB protein